MLNFILQITSPAVVADTINSAAQVATQTTTAAQDLPVQADLRLWDMIVKGGPIMIPLGLLSVVAVYFIIERLIVISKSSRVDRNFMNMVRDHVHNGNIEAARNLCKTSSSPVARMVEKGISRIGSPVKDIEDAMETVGKQEIYRMEKNMGLLSLVARLAPMLGFVGTIIGVIKIFYDISLTDKFSIGIISGGLYQKLVTSAMGLIIGILAFAGYQILNSMIDKAVNKMERSSMEFVDLLHEPVK